MVVADFAWPVPRSAYIHVPFCRHRCGYCNFSVIADRDDLIDRYLRCIDRELARLDRPSVDTVFIGGGTPTHLSPDQISRLLDIVHARFEIQDGAEVSVEANPEDIDAARIERLVGGGVNRISLGVQSFDDDKLAILQRGHTGRSARRAIELAAESIANVSIDLIFAAPGETLDGWTSDLDAALSLPIKHVSTYALTFEKGTSFWTRRLRGDLSGVEEAIEVDLYQAARSMTAWAGWSQYEVSNFSLPGYRCRHNLAYWDGRGWFAAGPGAARFVGGRRQVNHRSTTTYLKRVGGGQSPVAEDEAITVEQYARERLAFGVRLIDGIDIDTVAAESGIDLRELCSGAIARSQADGLIEQLEQQEQLGQQEQQGHSGHLRLTEKGILFADTVATRLLG